MGWKETCPVDERRAFIREVLRAERSMAELCRAYGISRKTGYKWLGRYEEGGRPALEDRSHVPLQAPHAVDEALVQRLVAVRRQHPSWGARKVLQWLRDREPRRPWPAASTVYELLRRHGLTKVRRRGANARTPHSGAGLVDAYAPNVSWSLDFKGQFRTLDRRYCYPLTVSDVYSRYLLVCRGGLAPRTEFVQPVLERAFREYGLPQVMRSDNGSPFASKGLGGLSKLALWWIKLGILPERIRPGRPQENGRHERIHRTLKEDTLIAANLGAQQRLFDDFMDIYNNERPHEALEMRPPVSAYRPSEREYPRRIASVEYPGGFDVRQVRQNGEIKFDGGFVFLSQVLVGEPIGLQRIDEQLWTVHFGFLQIGFLDAPSGRVQRSDPRSSNLQRGRGGLPAAAKRSAKKAQGKTKPAPKVSPILPG